MCYYNEKKSFKEKIFEDVARFGMALVMILVGIVAVVSVIIVAVAIIHVMIECPKVGVI